MLSVPMALVTAGTASAATTCQTSTAPINVSSEASLKVGCIVDVSATATQNADHIQINDALNAAWHRGAARTVSVTTANASTTITFAVGNLGTVDLHRPISGTGIAAAAFVRSVLPAACTIATCTSAVLSGASTASGTVTATIEHTTARVITDAHYTAGATSDTLTSATAGFTAADVRKSVSGGGFPPGARIKTFTNATTVVVAPGSAAANTTGDTITLGTVQYTALTGTVTTYTDANTREMARTTSSGTASCTGSTLTITAAGGGTNVGDIGLKVQFLVAGVAQATAQVTAHPTATTDTLSATCPAVAWTNVVLGETPANAPKNGTTVATLGASLNLNPTLNATSDDCNKNTYEGFGIAGAWNNPGSYATTAVLGAPSDDSTAQIVFPTSVVAFAAYVQPHASDTHQAGAHFNVIFPTLPTSLAVCPIVAGTTTTKTAIDFGFLSTTLSTAPFLPTGSGNPSSPGVRQVGPTTGAFNQKISLFHGATSLGADVLGTSCTFIANTTAPTFGCGLG
jgi:hypothetical protein